MNALGARSIHVMSANMPLVLKMAKLIKQNYSDLLNFEEAYLLLEQAKKKLPCVVILDWDTREAEGFKYLNESRDLVDLKKVPVIGFVSQSKVVLKDEAERAGCDRVYTKSEFSRTLPDILMRYAL